MLHSEEHKGPKTSSRVENSRSFDGTEWISDCLGAEPVEEEGCGGETAEKRLIKMLRKNPEMAEEAKQVTIFIILWIS